MKTLSFLQKKPTSVQQVVIKQLRTRINKIVGMKIPSPPKDGWIRTIRQALGMSGTQLAERLCLTRNQISILERKEANGSITLNQLRELAEALDADLIYAVAPRKSVEETIDERAHQIASSRLNMSHQNMFLEAQQISDDKKNEAVEMLVTEIKAAGGKLLWKKDLLER